MKKMLNNEDDEATWKRLVLRSSVTRVFDFELLHVDHTLILAFVERWHPHTNTCYRHIHPVVWSNNNALVEPIQFDLEIL